MTQTAPPTRRQLLVGAAGATAVAATTWAVLSSTPPGTATIGALGPVRVGDVIGDATVVAIHAPYLGAVPVIMQLPSGTRFQIDVLVRDADGPAGIAETPTLSLYLANGGDGATATDEGQGLVVMALAEKLGDAAPPDGLLTLAQRSRQHPRGAFGVPLS